MALPGKVSGYQSATINAIIEHLRMNQLRASNDHRLVQTSNGITLQNAKGLNSSEDGIEYKRFRVDENGVLSVLVNAGTYTCNGKPTATTEFDKSDTTITGEGNDIDGYAGAFSGAGDKYVYLEKYATAPDTYKDATLDPDGIKIVCAGTFPNESDQMRHKYWRLAKFEVNASLEVIADSIVLYWIGDIDELTIVPDGEMSNALQYPIKTLEWRKPADGGQYQMQMNDAEIATLQNGEGWSDRIGIAGMLKNAPNGDGELEWYGVDTDSGSGQNSIQLADQGQFEIYGMPYASDPAASGYDFCMRDGAGGSVVWVDVANSVLAGLLITAIETAGTLKHTNLAYTFAGGLGVGKSVGNTDHDDSYWHEYTTSNNTDAKDFHTSGEVWADDFKLNDADTTNFWNAEGFNVQTTGDIDINSTAGVMTIGDAASPPSIDIFGDTTTVDGITALYLSGTNIYYNTQAGWSGTFQATQNGITVDVTVTNGGITNVA